MGRRPTSTSYVTRCIRASDGVEMTPSNTEFGRGAFTLANGVTYYFILGGRDAPYFSAHMLHDAAIIITSATVETCDFPESEILDSDASTAGKWIDEDPTTAFVGTKGAGTTATNGVVAVAGGNAGGARWNIAFGAQRRMRIAVLVGGTGGEVVFASWGKE